jgi:hypothetical protein
VGRGAICPGGQPPTTLLCVSLPLRSPFGRALGALCGAALVLGLWSATAAAGTHAADKATSKSKSTTTTTTAPSGSTTTTSSAEVTAADTWLIKAIGADEHLGSVRIKGTIKQGKVPIGLALLVNGDGEGGGTFTQQGSTIQLKRVGPLLYFNAPSKFWAAHASKAQTKTYGGKWIEVSALDTRFQSFDQFLNAGDLVAAVFQGHTTPLTISKETTLNGHKVYIVGDTITLKKKKYSGQMYISATGKPYVLKIVYRSPVESGTITFSSYGRAVSIVTPPEPINLS